MLYNLGLIPPIAPSNPKQDSELKETTAKKSPNQQKHRSQITGEKKKKKPEPNV